MKKKVICLAYGKGGHQEQMQRLICKLEGKLPNDVSFVIFTDSEKQIKTEKMIEKLFIYSEIRDKHSLIKTFYKLPMTLLKQSWHLLSVNVRYNVVGFVTTGPGVAILPAYLCKFFNCKVIAFESWSRFEKASNTGKLLNRVSDIFFIQNKSLKSVYKKYVYRGKL